MEPQAWRGLGVEWRCPDVADVLVACALYYLLHLHPEVPEFGALGVALGALRCVRYRRRAAKDIARTRR